MTAGTLFSNTNIITAITDPFVQASVDFTPASTGDYYIGFRCFSDADQAFLYIDDIEVDLTPSCSAPTGLTNTNITHNAADHSWTAPGVPPSNGYYWIVSTSATPPANGSGTATAGTSASTPSGLLPVTQYYLHVQSYCGGATYSAWATQPFTTSFDCSVAEVISGCGVSKSASLSGTGAYSITACGFSTPGTEKLYSFTPGVTGNYTLNITAANGEYIDYFYKDAAGGCGPTGWTCIDDNNAVGTDVFGPLTAGNTYYILLDPEDGGVTSTVTFQLDCPVTAPPNDLVCNAIALTLGGPQDCQNTTGATAAGDPGLPATCSSPNNTVWYSYTPASTGPVIIRAEIPGATSNPLNGWVAIYTATGTCPVPGLTLTALAGSSCLEFGQTGAGDIDDLTTPSLTGGTTYYFLIDGFSGDAGEFCISLVAPPPPPACTTNLTPVNGATGVLIPGGATAISWNAAATATSYDVYFGTVNPPTTNIGNTAATTVNITGLSYNTTYYWYVVPRNTGGPATGCDANTTSFTTENPTNCTPLYTTGCTSSDVISLFRIKGESSELNINTGTACNSSAYVDSTDHSVTIQMARGKSYWGQALCGFSDNYITIWIDGNDNGYFESTERLMSNLLVGATLTNFNLFIPLATPLGVHRMRVRNIYSGSAPTTPTDPCNPYAYGETEDYNVEVTAGGSSYTVSTYAAAGACYTGGGVLTVNSESNNNTNYVPLVDSTNSIIAQLYPQGNNLGRVSVSYYKHNAAVRQDLNGRYYLDRNITITTSVVPTAPYNLRLHFLNAELNALIAQPGSGVTSIFDLITTKNDDACLPALGNGGAAYFPTGFGSIGGDRFLRLYQPEWLLKFLPAWRLHIITSRAVNFCRPEGGNCEQTEMDHYQRTKQPWI
ncbi:MAG: GEVED domain-containing protein [Chitinophagaceae bacterium]